MTNIKKELVSETRIDIQKQMLICPYCDSVMQVVYTRSMDVSENIDIPLFCKRCHSGVGGVATCGLVAYDHIDYFDGIPLMSLDEIIAYISREKIKTTKLQ